MKLFFATIILFLLFSIKYPFSQILGEEEIPLEEFELLGENMSDFFCKKINHQTFCITSNKKNKKGVIKIIDSKKVVSILPIMYDEILLDSISYGIIDNEISQKEFELVIILNGGKQIINSSKFDIGWKFLKRKLSNPMLDYNTKKKYIAIAQNLMNSNVIVTVIGKRKTIVNQYTYSEFLKRLKYLEFGDLNSFSIEKKSNNKLILQYKDGIEIKASIDINKTIAAIPLSTSFDYDKGENDYSKMLTERIQTAIEQTKRFIMVDRMDLEKVLKIKKDQNKKYKGEFREWKKISQSHLVKAGRQLGVEYIFTGNISNVSTPITITGNYSGSFGFTIKAISVETGKLYQTQDFTVKSKKVLGYDSKSEALNAALKEVVKPVQEFIDKYFPIEVPFYKVKDITRKGLPKTIIIAGGLSNGLRNGQDLDIAILDEIESDYREKIGTVKIIEIESKYATCKIKSGASKINSQIQKDKTKIIAKSQAFKKKGIFKRK